MRNFNKALLIVAILLVGGAVGFFVFGSMTAGSIDDSFNFAYEPSSPDPIEELTFNVDIGSLLFKYNTSPTSLYADIDVDMEITGWYMEGKTYLDFFNPSSGWWDNSTATFNLLTIPDVWFNPSHWFKSYNITITVTLRTDLIYGLTALTSTGDIEMEIPDDIPLNGVSLTTSTGSIKFKTLGDNGFLGNVRLDSATGDIESYATKSNFSNGFHASTSTGDLTLNFTNCLMGNNLIGSDSTGDVNFRSYNMLYSTNIILHLETSTGDVNVFLYQYTSMGANITGTWETSTGDVDVLYRDNLIDTNVRFVSSIGTGSINYTPHATMEITSLGSTYSTLNYGDATYRYVFSLDTSTGNIYADAQSS